MEEYLNRRINLSKKLHKNSIVILPGAKLQTRNGDAEYAFRQNSDFYYLTGFNEPDAVLAICKDDNSKISFVLFNQPHDPTAEIWNGKRAGQLGAKEIFGADEAYDIEIIDMQMPELLANKQNIYYPLGLDQKFDLQVLSWINAAKKYLHLRSRGENQEINCVPDTVIDVLPLIHAMRLFKSEAEIDNMRKAAEISANAHKLLMQQCFAGQMEYQLESLFNAYCLNAGCRGLAYNSIVAGGNNSCTLHYITNDQALRDGDLVLVDAGAEYNNYASDITRTFPVNRKFTPEQRAIYSLVLEAQLAGIEQIKPGNQIDKVQTVMVEILVQGLVKLGILTGDVKQLIKNNEYRRFYMHSSGHWLGLDVHDVGLYKINGKYREFEPGMVLTVEPGIYISKDQTNIDPKWLGIGVRIEDDVLVTKKGHEVLSAAAPKTIEEIESATL